MSSCRLGNNSIIKLKKPDAKLNFSKANTYFGITLDGSIDADFEKKILPYNNKKELFCLYYVITFKNG